MTKAATGMAWRGTAWAVAALVACAAASASAAAATQFEIGSRVAATAEPPVSRPDSKPCMVTLFADEAFDDHGDGSSMAARPHRFDYAPPMGCGERWGKVVLEADFSVPAGRQFDRTVALWLGGVNLYFGTTLEPEPDVAQHWRVERDLSDYAALFRSAHPGQMILNNWVSPTTNQPIRVRLRLLFYPASAALPGTTAASRVYALSGDARGEQAALENGAASLSRSFTFPRNIERAWLDVTAQSQAHDERWYTCVDQAYLARTRDYSLESFEACDGGSYRGVEVLVDGQPAGLAPVYPWIFTGGVAPHLWLPTPAIQTTSFVPARVDLTPFAGLFDDGQPHTVAVRVPGADHFFNVAANLLVYQAAEAGPLAGEVVQDTLAAQAPTVRDTLHADAQGRTVGDIVTELRQAYVLVGRLHTPRGEITTTVNYSGSFRNRQEFARPGAKRYDETIAQDSDVSLHVARRLDGRTLDGYDVQQHDPLHLLVRKTMHGSGQDFTADVAMRLGDRIETRRSGASDEPYHAVLDEQLESRVRADGKTIPDPLDRSTFAHHEAGSESVVFTDSLGSCYRTTITSRDEALASVVEGKGCRGDVNHIDSRARPDDPWLFPLSVAGQRADEGNQPAAPHRSGG